MSRNNKERFTGILINVITLPLSPSGRYPRRSVPAEGNFKLVVEDKLVQKQARKSVKLNREKAEEFFKSKGIWEEVIEIKEEINEDFVEQDHTYPQHNKHQEYF